MVISGRPENLVTSLRQCSDIRRKTTEFSSTLDFNLLCAEHTKALIFEPATFKFGEPRFDVESDILAQLSCLYCDLEEGHCQAPLQGWR